MLEKVDNVLKTIGRIPENSCILVAVSGGPDSMCLLDILSKLSYHITIGHLNHKLRLVADRESEFVIQQAKKYNFSIISEEMNIKKQAEKNNSGIEETARRARYEFLFWAAKISGSVALLTAHHADDQVESILMNFIRGTGLKGLAGMQYCSLTSFHPEIPLIRPLLDFWKEDILSYCDQNQLEYCEDLSNKDTRFLRNKIRHQLIPSLIQCNPNFKNTCLRNHEIFLGDWQYIHRQLQIANEKLLVKKNYDYVIFSKNLFNTYEISIQRYLIRDFIKSLLPDYQELSFDLIEDTRIALISACGNISRTLNDGLFLLIENGRVIITTDPQKAWHSEWPTMDAPMKLPVENGITRMDKNWEIQVEKTTKNSIKNCYRENTNRFMAYIDLDSIDGILSLRFWKAGDSFKPLGMEGKTVKLSDLWINHKIPKCARKKWPLLVDKTRIIWIPGFPLSDLVRITKSSRNVLTVKFQRSDHSED